jgi:hypothetical protein
MAAMQLERVRDKKKNVLNRNAKLWFFPIPDGKSPGFYPLLF